MNTSTEPKFPDVAAHLLKAPWCDQPVVSLRSASVFGPVVLGRWGYWALAIYVEVNLVLHILNLVTFSPTVSSSSAEALSSVVRVVEGQLIGQLELVLNALIVVGRSRVPM